MLLDERDDIIPELFTARPFCLPFQVLRCLNFAVVDIINNAVESGIGHDYAWAVIIQGCPSIDVLSLFFPPVLKGPF